MSDIKATALDLMSRLHPGCGALGAIVACRLECGFDRAVRVDWR